MVWPRGSTAWTGTNLILLGVILGLMMAFDMGGPVNKVAYTFATTGLAAAAVATTGTNLQIMAAVMAAGMTPPLGAGAGHHDPASAVQRGRA